MARATAIDIDNLFNHKETHLELTPGIALFSGEEGSGKSAILGAFDLALTGRCRLERVDGSHLTNDALWGAISRKEREEDEEIPRVRLGLEGVEGKTGRLTRNSRGWSLKLDDGTAIETKDGLAAFLGVRDIGAVEAALRSQRFAEMTSEEKTKLLFACLGKTLTVETLIENGIDDEDIQHRILEVSVESGRNLAAQKKQAYNRDAKKRTKPVPAEGTVETLQGPKPVRDIPREGMEKLLVKLEKEKAEYQERLGRLKAIEEMTVDPVLVREAEADVEKAAKAHAKAAADLARFLESEETAKATEWKETKARLTKDYEAIQADLTAAIGQKAWCESDVLEVKERLRHITEHGGEHDFTCPWCAQSTTKEKALERMEAAVKASEARLEEARSKVTLGESGLAAVKKEGQALLAKLTAYSERLTKFKDAEKEAREALESVQRHRDRSKQRAEEAKASIQEQNAGSLSMEEVRARIAAVDERIANVTRILSAIAVREAAIRDYEANEAEVETIREAARKYEKMEEALSDTGFLAARVQEPLALLRAKVEQVGAALLRNDLHVEVSDKLVVTMRERARETGSKGEQWLVGAVLAVAFASLSGFGIVVLDDFDKVGARSRDKVMAGLAALVKSKVVDQVFIASVRGRDGWCDACGALTVADSKGGCLLVRGGAKCGAKVGLSRPRGPMVGILRSFLVENGQVEEVSAVGQEAVTA